MQAVPAQRQQGSPEHPMLSGSTGSCIGSYVVGSLGSTPAAQSPAGGLSALSEDSYTESETSGSLSINAETDAELEGVMGQLINKSASQNSLAESFNDVIDTLNPMKEPPKEGTVKSSIFNLVSTIIGGGVLSLPYAFRETGMVLGSLILIFVALMSTYSAILLVACGRRSKARSYDEIAWAAFQPHGHKAKLFVSLMVFVLCCLAAIGYVILLGDLLQPVASQAFGTDSFFAKRKIVQLGCVLITSPITLLKNISSLRYTSFFAILSIIFLGSVMISRSIESDLGTKLTENQTPYKIKQPIWFKIGGGCLNAFSIMACAFLCHFNILPTQHDLNDPTRSRLQGVIMATMGIAFFLYELIAVFGYLQFRDHSCDNVLKNYDKDDGLISAGRCALAVTLLLSFPLLTHPCRSSLETLIFNGQRRVLAFHWTFLETVSLVACFYLIGSSIKSIVTVWSFLGSTVAIVIGFIMPAVMYLKLREPNDITATFIGSERPRMKHSASGNAIAILEHEVQIGIFDSPMHPPRFRALILLFLGVCLLFACTTQSILNVIQDSAEDAWCQE